MPLLFLIFSAFVCLVALVGRRWEIEKAIAKRLPPHPYTPQTQRVRQCQVLSLALATILTTMATTICVHCFSNSPPC